MTPVVSSACKQCADDMASGSVVKKTRTPPTTPPKTEQGLGQKARNRVRESLDYKRLKNEQTEAKEKEPDEMDVEEDEEETQPGNALERRALLLVGTKICGAARP